MRIRLFIVENLWERHHRSSVVPVLTKEALSFPSSLAPPPHPFITCIAGTTHQAWGSSAVPHLLSISLLTPHPPSRHHQDSAMNSPIHLDRVGPCAPALPALGLLGKPRELSSTRGLGI